MIIVEKPDRAGEHTNLDGEINWTKKNQYFSINSSSTTLPPSAICILLVAV